MTPRMVDTVLSSLGQISRIGELEVKTGYRSVPEILDLTGKSSFGLSKIFLTSDSRHCPISPFPLSGIRTGRGTVTSIPSFIALLFPMIANHPPQHVLERRSSPPPKTRTCQILHRVGFTAFEQPRTSQNSVFQFSGTSFHARID